MSSSTADAVVIRRYTGAEARDFDPERLVAVYTQAYAGNPDPYHSPEQYRQRLLVDPGYVTRPDYEVVTAERSGELVGFLNGASAVRRDLHAKWWTDVHTDKGRPVLVEVDRILIDIAVRPDQRRQGIASGLHEAWGGSQPGLTASLGVESENPARSAYRAWGYVAVGRVQDAPTEPVYSIMVRPRAVSAPTADPASARTAPPRPPGSRGAAPRGSSAAR